MFSITVDKIDLITKVKANRDEHRQVFEEAIVGYRKFVHEQLEAMIAQLEAGKTIKQSFSFVIPEDHTDDYDRVIGMLEMDLEGRIVLDESLYRMYVDNDWDWARNFAVSNSGYTQMAGTSYGKFVK